MKSILLFLAICCVAFVIAIGCSPYEINDPTRARIIILDDNDIDEATQQSPLEGGQQKQDEPEEQI